MQKNLWNNPPRWSSLAKIGNSKITKSTVVWIFVVPLVARILDPINSIQFSFSGKMHSIDLALPFHWQLLFFSALFFAIATIVHTIFCPKLVATYDSYPTFKRMGRGSRTLTSVMSKTLLEDKYYGHVCKTNEAAFQFLLDYAQNGENLSKQIENSQDIKKDVKDIFFDAEIPDDKLREAFVYVYSFKEDLKLNQRRLILALYIFGFSCLFAILAQNVYFVVTN